MYFIVPLCISLVTLVTSFNSSNPKFYSYKVAIMIKKNYLLHQVDVMQFSASPTLENVDITLKEHIVIIQL
jgi:hypothetical protein